MADKFLLVPGTGGVDFKREDGTPAPYGKELVWGHLVGDDAEFIAELSCEHPVNDTASGGDFAPTKTSLAPGRSLSPFQTLLGTAYNKLPLSYGSFPYDWRLDIRHNGKLLLDFLRAHRQGAQRWRLIGHSQGGLVILAASKLCASESEFGSLVSKIALVGCPVYGTMRAANAMIIGDNFGGVASNFFRKASRTWPSMFQMLPVYRGAVRGRVSWTGLSDELWQGFDGGALVPLLARARHFRAWLHDGGVQSHLRGDIDLRLYYANNHPTPHRFGFDAGKLALLDETVDGDSLVPFERTLMALNRAGLREFTRALDGDTVMEHLSLLNDGRVAAVVTAFLEAGA